MLGDDAASLEKLRSFRDGRLAKSLVGLKLMELYYTHADSINAMLDRNPGLRAFARHALTMLAPVLGAR